MNATRRPHAPTRRRAQRLHRLRRCVTPTAFAAAMACMLPAQAADYGWYAGSYTSTFLPTTITLNDTLWLDCPPAYCGTKVLNTDLVNNGTLIAQDTLYWYYGNTLTNNWQIELRGDVGLRDQYGYNWLVNNSGLVKTAGTGESVITVNSAHASGAIVDAMVGTLNFAGGSANFANGAILMAAAGAGVSFTGGSASFADGVRFTGDGQYLMAANASFGGAVGAKNLTFSNASWTGGDGAGNPATLTSNATWSGGGTFNGQWAVASGQQLNLVGTGSNKYIGSSASLVNHGTIDAQDDLRFYYASGLDNRGTYRLNGDVSLYEGYGYSGFTNSGTVAKVAGAGSSVSNVNFYNSGTVRADSGTLNFVGGGLYFHDGTQFRGAGRVQVSTNANFDGAIGSENLVLTGGSWQGSNATLSGRTVWQDSGTLNGQWTVASGAQLHLTGAGNKYIGSSATLTNHGTVEMNDTLRLYYASTVDNHGQWNINGDHGLYESYGYSQVVNQGTITKTAGAGTSQIGVAFTNLGTVDVRSGTIELPANFNNAGTLQGIGSFRTNQLYNAGHVGIGGAPGTLTLDGHLTQLASGTLDFNLFHLGATDRLNVMGNVLLDGTLALNCFGACSFAMGADILLLDGHGSLSGAFSNLALTGFAPGSFNVVYDSANADVWLHVNQNITAAVPEPETYALFLAGLGLLGISARRRHLSQS